jgi:hypothetical protein
MKKNLLSLFGFTTLFSFISYSQCTESVTDSQEASCEGFTWTDGNLYSPDNYVPITTTGDQTPVLFSLGPNVTWTNVYTACTIGDGNNGAQQTLVINVTELPVGGANYRVTKTLANGNFFNGNPQTLVLGLNTINVTSPDNPWGDRTVKFQFGSDNIHFSTLSLNGSFIYEGTTQTLTNIAGCDSLVTLDLTFANNNSTPSTEVVSACNSYTWSNGITYTDSNYISSTTIADETPGLFIEGPNATWTNVFTACIIGDGNNGAEQTFIINVSDLPSSIVNYRVVKTVANGQFDLGNTQILTLGNNIITVPGVTFDRTVKFQFSNDAVEFDAISLNDISEYSGLPTQMLTTVSGCDSIVSLDLTITSVNAGVNVLDDFTLQAEADAQETYYQWVDCNNQNLPIGGQTEATFTPETPGVYAVNVTFNNCSLMSDCFEIRPNTGMDILKSQYKIQLFPNPTLNNFTISLEGIDFVDMALVDIHGKVLLQESGIFDQDHINLSEFEPGTYFVRFITSDGIRELRVTKQ